MIWGSREEREEGEEGRHLASLQSRSNNQVISCIYSCKKKIIKESKKKPEKKDGDMVGYRFQFGGVTF